MDGSQITTSQQLADKVQGASVFQSMLAMQAGIVTVTGGDFAGTYLYVRRPAETSDLGRDLFVKLENPKGLGAVGPLDVAAWFDVPLDKTAPAAVFDSVNYYADYRLLVLQGKDVYTLLSTNETSNTNLKANLDWSKLTWDINGDDGVTADIKFTLADIESAVVSHDRLKITLTAAKQAQIAAAQGVGNQRSAKDTIDIANGFQGDSKGNVSTQDGAANVKLKMTAIVDLGTGGASAPSVEADYVQAQASAVTSQASVDMSNVYAAMFDVPGVEPGKTITLTNANHVETLFAGNDTSPSGAINVTGSAPHIFTGNGNDTITSTSQGSVEIEAGGGADVITGGTGANTYVFSPENFNAVGADALLAAADTITNWNAALSNRIDFQSLKLAAVAHGAAAVAGKAGISAQGLASFNASDTTAAQKLAAVAAATDGDPLGTSVIFNDGGNAYVYVVGSAGAGVQSGDALIKLNGVTAGGLVFKDGGITALAQVDNTAPNVSLSGAYYREDAHSLHIIGSGFETLFNTGEDRTIDIKSWLDWSKLRLDVRFLGTVMSTVTFSLADIESVHVTAENALDITLTQAKHEALLAMPDFGAGPKLQSPDKLNVDAGFIKDAAGNVNSAGDASIYGVSNYYKLWLTDGASAKPVTGADEFFIAPPTGNSANSAVDFAQVKTGYVNMAGLNAGQTITVTNLGKLSSAFEFDAFSDYGNHGRIIATSVAAGKFNTGDGNDVLTANTSGDVTFRAGGGADVMTGGTGKNSYIFQHTDFNATSAADLLKAADTITNWNSGSGNVIAFESGTRAAVALKIVAHDAAPVLGRASVAYNGVASFARPDNTVQLKLAALVAAMANDEAGTTAIFTHGTDTYMYVVGNSAAGVQEGDGLIKLNGVSANSLVIEDGKVIGFERAADTTPPTATINNIQFFEGTRLLVVTGENFNTLLAEGETVSARDMKGQLDWTKLSLSLYGASGDSTVTFTAADIDAVKLSNDGSLQIMLTADKAAAIKASTGYGTPVEDNFTVDMGFLKDVAGNVATQDSAAGQLVTIGSEILSDTAVHTPSSATDFFVVDARVNNAALEAAGIQAGMVNVNVSAGNVVTVTHLDHDTQVSALGQNGSLIASGSGATRFEGGNGNDTLTSTSTGPVTFIGGAGADKITGGTGANTFVYDGLSGDFNAGPAADLLAGADTITNWNAGAGNKIVFAGKQLHSLAATTASGSYAGVNANGMATFSTFGDTLEHKIEAIGNRMKYAEDGASMAFNHNGDAYLYVHSDGTGSQAGNALIKLAGVTASALKFTDGMVTGFSNVGTTLTGTSGADSLVGTPLNDVLKGGLGNDMLNGGDGLDTAVFSGALASSTVTKTAGGYTVQGPDGIDSLVGVERLKFDDKSLALDVDGVPGQVYRLMETAFSRTPDPEGLGYWIAHFDSGAATQFDLAQTLAGTQEFKGLAGNTSTSIITYLYQAVLHTTPNADGLAYWANVLDNKQSTVSEVLYYFAESTENVNGTASLIGQGIQYIPHAG
ncbi:DUF4214 domain-containing protein [Pseudoduganella ginsengisoli]|nr:DUF4214 domain-containing protein [Pseudoduganella ginsengisoli]